jgi:hypothetical protein
LNYSPLVSIAFFGAIPLSVLVFLLVPARRASLIVYLACWLFLPVARIDVPGFIDVDKAAITAFAVLIGFLVTDAGRMSRLRWSLMDLPVLIWCACPIWTSVANDLGAYDGFSNSIARVLTWGVPYFIGRLYFADLSGLRELAVGMVAGGLVYVPLCLWEVRMSPQLHTDLYGFYQHHGGFAQSVRGGGFRPLVFMNHGLMLGLWMSATTLIAIVLWRSGQLKRLFGVRISYLALLLLVTAVLCKSSGALGLLVLGLACLWSSRSLRTALPVVALLVIPSLWSGLRGSGLWSGEGILDVVSAVASERGTESLAYRMEAEDLLSEKSREQALVGWGGFGRGLVPWDKGPNGLVVADGLWIIAFNLNGAIGLISLLCIALVPISKLMRRIHVRLWTRAELAPVGALATVLMIYFVDNLLNAMVNPVYTLIAGGLTGLVMRERILPSNKQPRAMQVRRALPSSKRPLCELPGAAGGRKFEEVAPAEPAVASSESA